MPKLLEETIGAQFNIVSGYVAGQDIDLAVVTAEENKSLTYRWRESGQGAIVGMEDSLVTFELTPRDGGTLLRMTETGFREMGWEVAVLEQQYRDHVSGWDHFLPRLVAYAPSVGVTT